MKISLAERADLLVERLLSIRSIEENVQMAKQLVAQGQLSQEDFDTLVGIDPSPKKKYVGWMARQWASKAVSDIDVLRNTVEEFNTFAERGKVKNPDIQRYKTFDELAKAVNQINDSGEAVSSSDLENDYEIIRDDADLFVAVPHTHEASRKLGLSYFSARASAEGKDCAWCTTYKNGSHFLDYYHKHTVTLYYIAVRSKLLQKKLRKAGYDESFDYVAVAVLNPEHSDAATARGLDTMEAYDGLDRQFKGQKLSKYLSIIGLK